jgi:hypothetical protein
MAQQGSENLEAKFSQLTLCAPRKTLPKKASSEKKGNETFLLRSRVYNSKYVEPSLESQRTWLPPSFTV